MTVTKMSRRYCLYDVFTAQALGGNPLAVVLDCEGLDTPLMQAIAGEFNLSETVFVFPAERPAHSASIRIFTPNRELPFAGHPTVGTAICLAEQRFGDVAAEQDAVIVLEEAIGAVRCGVKLNGAAGFAEFDIPQLPEKMECELPKDRVAQAIGLEESLLTFENHRPQRWTAGLPYNFIPVRNLAALSSAKPDSSAWESVFDSHDAYVYSRETVGHNHHFSARMFWRSGTAEDPATGSAAAAFAGIVHGFDGLPDGDHVFMIEQGYDMARPSVIRMECSTAGNQLQRVRIGGNAVKIAEGELIL